ncbi:DUF4157 domain-containing protein [Mycobacterium intracellulare]|uniref:Uncharacterized protein n=1 Tax=Mycobacterium intracellulare (strain ATCC 13950 / DSM 43223 / JCM 6384 / NCTC 13025 / 3600) TaxID=487521 RepID=H8IVS4_MYCIA|nr:MULTISPECIES: DUF4157 domain-containing protein [Mycobacterium avium complex (MAC)]AFC43492.1 hypothetical protein OCU_22730 [Mycobacterium intracellulare ATCC 13950]MCA2250580.1 DUF4157 domain-containing protein [Mycobacterium intracellulare]MCA2276537.1 DUF4157 domain-containing protein [Mycobacterium intracellulare]MCA2327977.1 DUF4157 domain-containing protein [Mycobacterium intracellulare]OBG02705.1 hypothetical protein A5769_11785 [Mycobacterium intracellulare]
MIVAAAVPFDAERSSRIRPPQLITPARSQASASTKSIVVGDRTVRLLGLGGPSSERLLFRVASDMGAAIGAVEAFWGLDWPREISIVAAGTDEEFRAAAGGGPAAQWADIAAATVSDRIDPVRRVALGQRIVFAPGAANMSAASLRIVLAHELFHYAARADTVADAPRWLTEGVADFVGRPPTPVPKEGLLPMTLPSDADLDVPGAPRSLAYDRAWWFARFVADTFGAPKLHDLYLATCGLRRADMATAAHDVLDTSEAGLLTAWRQWLTH